MSLMYLNHAPDFYKVYEMEPGHKRRDLLKKLFQRHPNAILAVNRKYCANLKDSDLAKLLDQGVVQRVREGIFKSRTTYLKASQ